MSRAHAVDEILDFEIDNGIAKYHVRWRDYEDTEWVLASNTSCPDLIARFHAHREQQFHAVMEQQLLQQSVRNDQLNQQLIEAINALRGANNNNDNVMVNPIFADEVGMQNHIAPFNQIENLNNIDAAIENENEFIENMHVSAEPNENVNVADNINIAEEAVENNEHGNVAAEAVAIIENVIVAEEAVAIIENVIVAEEAAEYFANAQNHGANVIRCTFRLADNRICNKTFTRNSSLNRHIERTHVFAQRFICCYCHRTFYHRDNITKHFKRCSVLKHRTKKQ